jgi:hypothetical protein
MLCAEPSLHCRTAMVVAERLLPGVRFSVAKAAPGGQRQAGGQQLYLVGCEGAAWAGAAGS